MLMSVLKIFMIVIPMRFAQTLQEGTSACARRFVGNGTYCEDRLDCDNNSVCNVNAVCVDHQGSYHCECGSGFDGNGRMCVDQHECDEDDTCSDHYNCIEEDNGYTCHCPPGFNINQEECVDIDECSLLPCVAGAHCHNTNGSFYCACPVGYYGDGLSGFSGCQDVNECNDQVHACPQYSTCENMDGGYSCSCNLGFQANIDLCIDIDECLDGLHNCDVNATCINLIGSFTCRCNHGFFSYQTNSLSGYATVGMCADINECTTSRPCRDQSAQSCLNREGSYQCICQVGSYRDSTGSCSDSNSLELRIIFSDVKGLKTQQFYELITDDILDQLSIDVQNLFASSGIPNLILQVIVTGKTRADNNMALITIRVDFDLKANMTIQKAHDLFGLQLSGRQKNIVPSDSIVHSYEVYFAENNLCVDGDHDCFENGYERCVPKDGGDFECSVCRAGYRSESGSCLADPCQTGQSDCSDRYFENCQYISNGQYSCFDCLGGFVQKDAECVPDPCLAGFRTCNRLNFDLCVPDGNNQFHCESCKAGFYLQNGACTQVNVSNPCLTGQNICQQQQFQTCVADSEASYHCENCLPGYQHEGDSCVSDPCQTLQNDCRARNFDRCLYLTGGQYTCDICKAGYRLEGSNCVQDDSQGRKRYRGKMRVIAVNDSEILANFHQELMETNSDKFKIYEDHICDVVINSIGITNSLLANRIDGCFVFHFRNGSIIPYFAIDVIQFGKTTDYSFDLTTALVNSGFSVPNGFISPTGITRENYSCAAGFEGSYCQMVSQDNSFTTNKPTAPQSAEDLDGFPAWSIALLAIAALLAVGLCSCCCCLFLLLSRRSGKSGAGLYRYPGQAMVPHKSVPVRNPLITSRRRTTGGLRNDNSMEYDNRGLDESSRAEERDRIKMGKLSEILGNADFLNTRMRNNAENRVGPIVRNPFAQHEEPNNQFERPHVVDGSEAKDFVNVHEYQDTEYILLSDRSSSSSSSMHKPDGSITSSESSI
ncbi:hypothetical protein BSL78_12683 [Apostichopus japonicus]|uniref:EGF-like domain-containing protein n=1 Tax=Stichopus japonicus TaxID=307972 RepID=A0A2G8KR05_STIJA|nr:hypothetical protein BSL78_12683 [Apostichopus japonicus]